MSLLVKARIEVPLRYKTYQCLYPETSSSPATHRTLPVGSLPLLSITFALQPAADLSLYFPQDRLHHCPSNESLNPPEYLHVALLAPCSRDPAFPLLQKLPALSPSPPIRRFPGRWRHRMKMTPQKWKRPVEAAISPAYLLSLPCSGFCRKLPGSLPPLPILLAGLFSHLLSLVSQALSTISLICLLTWGIKSPLFRQRNSLV